VLEFAGPVALISVIGTWLALLVIGWALIYWPHLPNEFLLASESDTLSHPTSIEALYLSMTTITTLGYGDITPTSEWLRIVTPLEAIFGFGLLTASLSWVISIYQVLRRRRSLALEISLLCEEQSAIGLSLANMEPIAAQELLSGLSSQLNNVWNDMLQFPITYYFASGDRQSALSVGMLNLLSLAQEGLTQTARRRFVFVRRCCLAKSIRLRFYLLGTSLTSRRRLRPRKYWRDTLATTFMQCWSEALPASALQALGVF
jgi:hypothetical protein